jgi:hypothetical protein
VRLVRAMKLHSKAVRGSRVVALAPPHLPRRPEAELEPSAHRGMKKKKRGNVTQNAQSVKNLVPRECFQADELLFGYQGKSNAELSAGFESASDKGAGGRTVAELRTCESSTSAFSSALQASSSSASRCA